MDRARRPIVRSRIPLTRRWLADPAGVRWWAAAVGAAILAATLVADAVDRADDARDGWGRAVEVVVTTRAITAGEPLGDHTRLVRWPVALAPPDHLDELPAGDAIAGRTLVEGLPVVTEDLRSPVPADRRPTLAIPLPDVHLAVRPGDRVDLWATAGDGLVPDGEPKARRVAEQATVTAADERSVTVAVRAAEVAGVAAAATGSTVVLVAAS